MAKPFLIACGDLHLCETAPIFRSAEPDWFAAQARSLRWLKAFGQTYACPIVIAGDLFDKAVGSSRLLNFAIDECPQAYAIAGNHDLPYHNREKLPLSAYGNLMRAGTIRDLDDVAIFSYGAERTVALYGFPYGKPFAPCAKQADIDVAVVHSLIWAGESQYSRIAPDAHFSRVKDRLPGYDFYIFGDNHETILHDNLVNCGTFYRRARGQETFSPVVALLSDTGIELQKIPVSQDRFAENVAPSKNVGIHDFTELFDSLRKAEYLTCDAGQMLKEYFLSHQVEPDVYAAIISITES